MQITLIRHLPTEWNKQQRLQGQRDIEISPPSKACLKEILENKKNLEKQGPYDYILSSTLKRTKQTAALYGYKPKPEPLLDEFDFGPFEGKEKELLLKVHGDKWMESPSELTFGEGMVHLHQRILIFLNKYKSAANLLLFSHGTWTRALISFHQNGHIDNMNKLVVQNNQCITLSFAEKEHKNRSGGLNLV